MSIRTTLTDIIRGMKNAARDTLEKSPKLFSIQVSLDRAVIEAAGLEPQATISRITERLSDAQPHASVIVAFSTEKTPPGIYSMAFSTSSLAEEEWASWQEKAGTRSAIAVTSEVLGDELAAAATAYPSPSDPFLRSLTDNPSQEGPDASHPFRPA
jgi:hypothetical protein